MSGLVNKIKEAVHSDKKDNQATDNPNSSNAGPHGSNAMNKADPRVDSDRDNLHSHGTTGAGYGTTGTSGIGSTGTTGAGYGSTGTSGIGNTGPTTGGYSSTTAGPHSSNIANKADPRVDSDRDGRGVGHGPTGTSGGIGNTSSTTGAGYGSTGTSGIGSTGTSGIGSTGAGYGSSNAGPHSSNIVNKADPRVDSDRDGRGIGHGPTGTSGGIGNTSSTTGAGYGSTGTSGISSTGTTGAGYGSTGTSGIGSTGTTGAGYGSTNAGPHSSNLANKADPRIDSDLDGGRSAGFGTSGTGHGDRSGYNQGTTGSGLDSSGVSATPGSGDASKTAGPHNSNLLNKLDPRVDSDMDGSKTVGGNATHQ